MKPIRILTGLLVATVIVLAFIYLPLADGLLALATWAQAHPGASWAVFAAAFALAVVLMVPAWPFMLLAGYLFGPVTGFILASLANLIGAVAAFLIGRHAGGAAMAQRARDMPRLARLSAAIGRHGLLVVVMSRAAVVIPHNLLNYAYALTPVRLGDYVLGSWLGTLPVILVPVMVGATATDLAALLRGEAGPEAGGWWVFPVIAVGVAGAVALAARVATSHFQRELRR